MSLRTFSIYTHINMQTFSVACRITFKKNGNIILDNDYGNELGSLAPTTTTLEMLNLILETVDEPPLTKEEITWHKLTMENSWI